MNRKALGKGIDALIPDFEMGVPEDETTLATVEILIEEIVPNPQQPRKYFDDEKLKELVDSIRENGIIQPVVVQKTGDNKYELVVGERRWRAAKQAGLNKIPVVVREISPTQSLALAIIENIHRQDLNPIEEAMAYQQLIDEFGMTQQAMAKQVGKNRSSITNFLRLLKLPSSVQEDLSQSRLSMGHARALLGVDSNKELLKLRNEILRHDLNVRQTEHRVRALSETGGNLAPKKLAQKDIFVKKLEERLGRTLGTKVSLFPGKKGGKLTIAYYSNEDLERICDMISKA